VKGSCAAVMVSVRVFGLYVILRCTRRGEPIQHQAPELRLTSQAAADDCDDYLVLQLLQDRCNL
jgi:hypothetical protein